MELLILVLIIAAILGYVMNIVKLVKARSNFSGFDAVRIVGIFIPILGSVLGFID
jgi:hypothetical protein